VGVRYRVDPRHRRCGRGAGDRLGRGGDARPSGRGHQGGPRHRCAGRFDLPFRHLYHWRGQDAYGGGGDSHADRPAGDGEAIAMTLTIEALEQRLAERASASPDQSYTAKLLAKGTAKCAQKLGEEAVETVIAAMSGDRGELVKESA